MVNQRELLTRLEGLMPADRRALARRREAVPTEITYPDLPITDRRPDLLEVLAANQVVIVAGETGSGKSTQLPKLCLELGRGVLGMIGHTQPRRIAARAIAERVAEELHTGLGDLVGYQVRFTDRVGDRTLIKVMTDGILLNEVHHDRLLEAYDTLIIDEAHERSLNIDFLLGYLATILPRRPDLKVIITSATIDTQRFSEHFGGAPIVEVSGRSHPVEVRYRPLDDPGTGRSVDQAEGIAEAVMELVTESDGDILVFCSGEREIRDAADAVASLDLRHTEVVPLFGRLSAAEQHRVFEPHTGRRVVIATNVAETSLTVPGIRAVVDAGTARISRFNRRTKVQRLLIEDISRASADQRAGRCGRLGPGICLRLYGEADFTSRDEFTEPEVLRTNLASVLLRMAALDLGDIESFPFVDPPDRKAVRDGMDLLHELGAAVPGRDGTGLRLTETGHRLARLPIDLRLGRMLLAADGAGCLSEVLIIAAALGIQDPRERPLGAEAKADQRHARFRDPNSDLLSWLHLWQYLQQQQGKLGSNRFRKLCQDEFLNHRRVREWQDVHGQLRAATRELGLRRNRDPATPDVLHRAVLTGLLSQIGRKDPDGHEYRGARSSRFSINPGSAMFKRNPEWVMAAELVETSRTWARQVAPINPEWAEEAGSHLVKRSHSDPWWDARAGAATSYETVTLYGLQLASDRVVQHHRTDPVLAREMFILHALVRGDWESNWEFVAHNRGRFREVEEMEARHRRTDFLRPEAEIVGWFDARVPPGVRNAGDFNRWWKQEKRTNPILLDLAIDDLLDPGADDRDDEAFPVAWHHGDLAMPLDYELEPGSETDGFIVDVPIDGIERVDPSVFDWLVPGLRRELITALLRGLPKPQRRLLVPIPDTVEALLERLNPLAGGVSQVLRREVLSLTGIELPLESFDLTGLPSHLRPYFRVLDPDGEVLAAGPDLHDLRYRLRDTARAAIGTADNPWEQSGYTSWGFGELPGSMEIPGPGSAVQAYPTLVDEGTSVGVHLVATPEEQAAGLWDGTRRLLYLSVPAPTRLIRSLLTNRTSPDFACGPYDSAGEWAEDCVLAALDRLIEEAGGPPRDGTGFDRLVEFATRSLADIGEEVARQSLELFATLRSLLAGVDRSTADVFAEAVADIRVQVDRLVFPGFIARVGGRVDDVRRYLAAMEMRLERLPENRARDRDAMVVVLDLEEELARVVARFPRSPGAAEVTWLLQELRVSLFAQSLGTRGKVSEARVRKAIREIAG